MRKNIAMIESVQKQAAYKFIVALYLILVATKLFIRSFFQCLSSPAKVATMFIRFTRLSMMFLQNLLYQKFLVNCKFSDFFQYRNSTTRSHSLTLMCKHSCITFTYFSVILLLFGTSFQLPFQTDMLLFLLFVMIVCCRPYSYRLCLYIPVDFFNKL